MEKVDKIIQARVIKLEESLDGMDPGSEEYSAVVNDIAKLQRELSNDYKMLAEIEQKDNEMEDARNKAEAEQSLANEEAKQRKKEFGIRLIFDGLVTVAGMGFYKILSNDTFKFESTGSITSGQGRRILQGIKVPKIGKF